MTPMSPERIGGLIEVPELTACLTLNKGDFIRTGARGLSRLSKGHSGSRFPATRNLGRCPGIDG